MRSKNLWFNRIILKRLKRRLNFKRKQVYKRQMQLGLPKAKRRFWNYREVTAPNLMSIKANPNDFNVFINKLKRSIETRTKAFVDMSQVNLLDHASITVLLAVMFRFKSHNIGFNGNFPYDPDARNLLKQSGFFEAVSKTFGTKQENYILGNKKSSIYTHGKRDIDQKKTALIIETASEFLWKGIRRCPSVQQALVELMHNTYAHAEPDKPREKHWWVSVYHDDNPKRVSFAFVDFGVGIFKSLETKPLNNKFVGWKAKLEHAFGSLDNSDILRLILNGQFHATVTGHPYRGEGLPGIKEAMDLNAFEDLHVITNEVHSDVQNKVYNKLVESFPGTFVCWELTENNENFI